MFLGMHFFHNYCLLKIPSYTISFFNNCYLMKTTFILLLKKVWYHVILIRVGPLYLLKEVIPIIALLKEVIPIIALLKEVIPIIAIYWRQHVTSAQYCCLLKIPFLFQGNLRGESVVAAIIWSRMETSYCTSGFFSS